MATVPISEASFILGITQTKLRRMLQAGEIEGERERYAGGFRWMIEIEHNAKKLDGPALEAPPSRPDESDLQVVLQARVDDLKEELEARRQEIQQLHVLLSQRALEPAQKRPWWRIW